MRKSTYTAEQKLKILAEWDGGAKVADLSRQYQLSPATLYKWRKEAQENEDADKRRIKELEAENARLKKMYANLSMDHEILQEGYSMIKKLQARDIKKK